MITNKNINTPQGASGCGGCAVKSEGNCTSHLTGAANIIVQGFIEARTIFDRSNQQHMSIVAGILAEDIRDDQGTPLAYEIPQEPRLRDWFLGLIAQRVKAGL